jgi:hypothetical protein
VRNLTSSVLVSCALATLTIARALGGMMRIFCHVAIGGDIGVGHSNLVRAQSDNVCPST